METLDILRSNRLYRFYWAARAISQLGDSIAQVALVLYVYHYSGNSTSVGMLLLAQVLPRMLGPFTGVLADRVEQRRLLILCDLLQALLFGTLACARPSMQLLVGLVILSTLISTVSSPAGSSALLALVSKDELVSANVLLRTSFNTAMMIGPTLAGFIVSSFGAQSALFFDALTFLGSALLLLRLPALPPAPREKTSFLSDTRDGLRFIVRHRNARTLTIAMFIYVAFAALDNIALVFLAHQSLGAGDEGFGFLSSAYGVGMVTGSLCLLRVQSKLKPVTLLVVGLGLFGSGTLLTGIAPALGFAIFFQWLSAFGNSFENVGTDAVIQQSVPRQMLGRVFGTMYSGMEVASGIAYVAGGPLLTLVSARTVFILSGIGVLICLLTAWRALLHVTESGQTTVSV